MGGEGPPPPGVFTGGDGIPVPGPVPPPRGRDAHDEGGWFRPRKLSERALRRRISRALVSRSQSR